MRYRVRLLAAMAVLGGTLATVGCATSPPTPVKSTPVTSTPAPAGSVLSGASGPGVTSGAFGSWRGEPVGIAGTWSDNNEASVALWQLQKGGDYANWSKPLDIAVGAIDDGESWKDAAAGDYDQRWTKSLENLKGLRSGGGTTYIRFAHEMNGNWYPWKVDTTNYRAFDVAWKRYRALQKKIFPAAKLVFSVNRESVGTGMDWRGFFPGAEYVDVVGVDYYNQNPSVSTTAEWKASLDDVDQFGAPKGLDKYRIFAESVQLPLAISEWSGSAKEGDSPTFVADFLAYTKSHGGTGPGDVLYEILFDVDQDDNNWTLYGSGVRMPGSAAAYRRFFAESQKSG